MDQTENLKKQIRGFLLLGLDMRGLNMVSLRLLYFPFC